MDLSNVGKNIRRLMKSRHMNIEQLSQNTGLGAVALSRLINGKDIFSLDDIEPVHDLTSRIASLGIKVWIREFGFKRMFGLSVGVVDGGPAIIVNDDSGIAIERQIFTMAHELGHLLLHGMDGDDTKAEREADVLAAEVLLSEKGLVDHMVKKISSTHFHHPFHVLYYSLVQIP
ncbi:MAG: XRE family transcriptional regulator [Sphaerochaetaceae bacterium]|nr:XRE family transcriptional regulator [Sphaerochaetaceae bacterium]